MSFIWNGFSDNVRRKHGFGRQIESLVGYKRKGEPILKSRKGWFWMMVFEIFISIQECYGHFG